MLQRNEVICCTFQDTFHERETNPSAEEDDVLGQQLPFQLRIMHFLSTQQPKQKNICGVSDFLCGRGLPCRTGARCSTSRRTAGGRSASGWSCPEAWLPTARCFNIWIINCGYHAWCCSSSVILFASKQRSFSSSIEERCQTLLDAVGAKLHLRWCNIRWCILPPRPSSPDFLPLSLVLSLMPTLCSLELLLPRSHYLSLFLTPPPLLLASLVLTPFLPPELCVCVQYSSCPFDLNCL